MEARILLIEDDSLVVESFKKTFGGEFRFDIFKSLRQFLDSSESGEGLPSYSLLLVDLMSEEDPDGEETLSLLPRLRKLCPHTSLVVQSGSEDIQVMRRAIAAGAERFLAKEQLLSSLPELFERATAKVELERKVEKLLVGESLAMRRLRSQVLFLHSRPEAVLIEGESGVGKELVAQALSLTVENFSAVNVNAVPKEAFEDTFFGHEKGAFTGASQARSGLLDGAGVLFLDEIQSLDLELQAKFLRVLEDGSYLRLGSNKLRFFSGRIVAASNRSLGQLVQESKFREDLFYRLSTLRVLLPPLRERREDIPVLVEHFQKQESFEQKKEWLPEALSVLQEYEWPGNVRQLKSVLKNIAVKNPIPKLGAAEVQKELLLWEENLSLLKNLGQERADGFQIDWELGLDANIEALEKFMFSEALSKHGSVKGREVLKVKKSRYYDKLKSLGFRDES